MTAINIVCLADAIHMFADGASTDANGKIAGIAPKVFALPHIKSVIGVRGSSAAATIFAHAVGFHSRSFDQLKLQIVEVFMLRPERADENRSENALTLPLARLNLRSL
jgi:hypothetical protein